MGTVVVLLLVATCLGMGIKLRTDSLPYHQNLWGIDWLVYYEEQGRALRHGNLVGWLLQWEGLHPPLSGVIHGFLQVLSVGWHVHWAATVSAGLLAALLLGLEGWRRASAVAPLILLACHSLSPLQANYGLNTSPYPWVLLLVGLSTVLLLRAVESDDRRLWWAAAIASALAAQVHVLALAAVGVQAIFVLLRRGWKRDQLGWLLLVCLSAAFLVVVSLLKAGDEWTFHISEEQPWIVSLRHVATSRFGELGPRLPLAVLLGLGIVGGLATRARAEVGLLLAQCLAMLAALAFFMEIHVADPRLTHYYTTPHLLFVAAGSWGLAHLGRRWGWRGSLAVLLLAAATAWPSISGIKGWHDDRRAGARSAMDASAGSEVRDLYEQAAEGDVIAYLWDHRFLNDEPEHLDPVAAQWPTRRLGRPCFDIEQPRMQCNQHGGAHFFFDPKSFSGEFEPLEETLRLVINAAHAPGRAQLVVLPGEEAPRRPWPVEPWFLEHGGVVRGPLTGGVLIWTFPVGLEIPSPPPLVPPGAPEESDQTDSPPNSDP